MANATYDDVEKLAALMLEADEIQDEQQFENAYNALHKLCHDEKGTTVDHPLQWEVLADFTLDIDEAIGYYREGLRIAQKQTNKEFIASGNYALTEQFLESGNIEEAKACIKEARKAAKKIKNLELKETIEFLAKEINNA